MTRWLSNSSNNKVGDIEIRGKVIPGVIVQILQNRGYRTSQAIEKFFAPSLADLHDPFRLNDMEKGVRIVFGFLPCLF